MATIQGTGLGETLSGTSSDDKIFGLGGNDHLLGYADGSVSLTGNDYLDGGEGADTMEGGDGDDHYIVDNPLDSIIDIFGQNDAVHAYVSYALGPTALIETMTTMWAAGTNPINLTGNGFGQSLYGNAGANVLDGGGGIDHLVGLEGNDHYIVDNPWDGVSELAGQGDDWVSAASSYVLRAGVSVETMDTTDAAGTAPVDLTGNEIGQSIYGNAGRNLLDGGGGVDYLVGLGGDDHYIVHDYGDCAVETDGEGDDWVSTFTNFTLTAGSSIETLNTMDASGTQPIFLGGNEFGQSIYGNAGDNYVYGLGGADYLVGLGGNDVLHGGQGNDYLLGGPGADVFQFDNDSSVDTIGDFDESDAINLGSFLGFEQFHFIGSSSFTGTAGQGRFADGKFELDVNGDAIPELSVNVHGTLTAANFVFWDDFL